jgi:uncharacterized membrane protein
MKKYFYILLGISLTVYSAILFAWFYGDFRYMIQRLHNEAYFARIFAPIALVYLGLYFLYFGIKSDKINKNSDGSFRVFIAGMVASFILMIIGSFRIIGTASTPTYILIAGSLSKLLSVATLVLSFYFSIVSFRK